MGKYKIKTKRAAAKRYKILASGRVKVGSKGRRHLLSSKARKRKRNLGQGTVLNLTDSRRVRRLMPYG